MAAAQSWDRKGRILIVAVVVVVVLLLSSINEEYRNRQYMYITLNTSHS